MVINIVQMYCKVLTLQETWGRSCGYPRDPPGSLCVAYTDSLHSDSQGSLEGEHKGWKWDDWSYPGNTVTIHPPRMF